MFFSIQDYWRRVRETEATLTEKEPWIVSIDNPPLFARGGCVVQVSRETAAKSIVDKTHRLASKEELNAHLAECERLAVEQAATARERAGVCFYPLSPKETRVRK